MLWSIRGVGIEYANPMEQCICKEKKGDDEFRIIYYITKK